MARSQQDLAEVLQASDLLYSADQVSAAFDALGEEITRSLESTVGSGDLLLLPVLKGGLYPGARLMERLELPFTLDYLHASRYAGSTQGGELVWRAEPFASLEDRVVLVVDDIFDHGQTLHAIVEYCESAGAAAVFSTTFIMKRRPHYVTDYRPNFVGLEVEDRYVFGCGMDFEEYFRGLPEIRALAD